MYNTNLLGHFRVDVDEVPILMQFKTVARIAACTGIAALCFAWSAASIAASNSLLPCSKQVAQDLQRLDDAVGEIKANAVDHELAVADLPPGATIESSGAAIDTISAPTLDLNPRVAVILDAVFAAESRTVSPGDKSQPDEEATEDAPPKTAPLSSVSEKPATREFHDQMYRKDI